MRETPVHMRVSPSSSWPQHQDGRGASVPSALLLAWIAHIRMSLEDVCDTSPRMWKRLNFMARLAMQWLHSTRPVAWSRVVGWMLCKRMCADKEMGVPRDERWTRVWM